MNRHPEPAKLADELERCATFLRRRGPLALRLAKDMQADASGGGGPSPKNAVSDPTGSAASSAVDNPSTESNRLRHAYSDLCHLMRNAHDLACDLPEKIMDVTKAFDDKGNPVKATTKRERLTPACAEPFCEDDSVRGRDGRCEACYRWRLRWAEKCGRAKSEAPNVPEHVIDERLAAREPKRIRLNPITGTEEVA